MLLICLLVPLNVPAEDRLTLNLNPDWRFIKSDPPGAELSAFDDREWETVSAPHTFNDTDTFDDWSLPGHRGEQNQWGGRTWYRKTLDVPSAWKGRKVYLEFEAVRQVAEVYLNGQLLGVSKNGFVPFGFDLTPHLRFGRANVLAVMCDNRFMKDPLPSEGADPHPSLKKLSETVNGMIPESVEEIRADQLPWNNPHWHPAHGGIYRNVRLHVTDPLHVTLPIYSFLRTAGPYAYAADISSRSARVTVEVPLVNERKGRESVRVRVEIRDHADRLARELSHSGSIASGGSENFKLSGVIEKPLLWEPAHPHLYRVLCSIEMDGETIDSTEIPLGIRAVRWDVQGGFSINGRPLKLRGWGQKPTDEWPGLGAAQPDWMHFLTLELMKEAGANMVRWGHCAGGPASIAAGDRLGLIAIQPGVDGESDTRGAAWAIRAGTFRDLIIYYRNNPSILIWEGGNQKVSREHARELRGYMDQYDPHGGRGYAHRRADKITAEFMDVGIGTEGGREIADLPVVEGEYNREESPRRVWDDFSPPNFGYHEGKEQTYHLNSEQFAVNQVSQYFRKLGAPEHSGGANWIFSDSTSGGRVATEVARASGEVDGVRLPKEAYFVCRAMFRRDPQVHLIGHWTYPVGTKKTVYVVSNARDVELFVNDRSLGRGMNSDRFLFEFSNVAWEPGEIKAVAYRDGSVVARDAKHTAGAPVALRITPTTGPGGLLADGSDVVLLDVEAVDAAGRRCPTVEQRVEFTVEGPGSWRGGYNSGKTNSINHRHLDLECGINRVAVRSTRKPGAITIRARSEGMKPARTVIISLPVPVEGGVTRLLTKMPRVPLGSPPSHSEFAPENSMIDSALPKTSLTARFTTSFSYSGPGAKVQLKSNAQNGKGIYVDREHRFAGLPDELSGADWIQAAGSDSRYNAVDLMEVAVKPQTVVSVAHDDRLPRPQWLERQFRSTNLKVTIDGKPMTVFQRQVNKDESLTLGANAEVESAASCHMYVVFVNGPSSLAGQSRAGHDGEGQ